MAQALKNGTLVFNVDVEGDQLNIQDGPNGYSITWSSIKEFVNGTQSLRLNEILVQVVERLINRNTDLENIAVVKTDLEQINYKLLN